MYFSSDEHRLHYMQLTRNDGYDYEELTQPEYQALLYVIAYPPVWQLWASRGNASALPHAWFIEEIDELPLSTSERCLLEAALSLFNDYPFSLGTGLLKWGDDVYKVFLQALEIRRANVYRSVLKL